MATQSTTSAILGGYRPVTPNLGARELRVGPAKAKVREEPFAFSSNLYAAPNEHDHRFFDQAVGGHVDGAIISVGTFRGFDRSTLTDGLTFLVDEARITDINVQLVKMISLASTRYELISWLMGIVPDPKRVPADTGPSAPGTRTRIDADYRYVMGHYPGLNTGELPPEVQRFHQALQRAGIEEHFPYQLRDELALQLRSEARWQSFFLGSDALFAAVKARAIAGKIIPVNASIAGDQGLASIAKALEANGQKLSLLDTSNVLQYLDDAPKVRALQENLARLPLAADARFLMTVRDDAADDGWRYLALPMANTQDALDAFARERSNPRAGWGPFLPWDVTELPPAPTSRDSRLKRARPLSHWQPAETPFLARRGY